MVYLADSKANFKNAGRRANWYTQTVDEVCLALNNRPPKDMKKKKLTELKGEINNWMIIADNFCNTSLSTVNQATRQKMKKEIISICLGQYKRIP